MAALGDRSDTLLMRPGATDRREGPPGQEGGQGHGAGVRPLQVVEDHQERLGAALQPAQHGHEPGGARVGAENRLAGALQQLGTAQLPERRSDQSEGEPGLHRVTAGGPDAHGGGGEPAPGGQQ
jgi:hypothetical protein